MSALAPLVRVVKFGAIAVFEQATQEGYAAGVLASDNKNLSGIALVSKCPVQMKAVLLRLPGTVCYGRATGVSTSRDLAAAP